MSDIINERNAMATPADAERLAALTGEPWSYASGTIRVRGEDTENGPAWWPFPVAYRSGNLWFVQTNESAPLVCANDMITALRDARKIAETAADVVALDALSRGERATIDAAVDVINDLREKISRAEVMLRNGQWTGRGPSWYGPCCPECGGNKTEGHRDGCIRSAWLAEVSQ